VVVVAYEDDASGTMVETANGGGRMTSVTLRPQVSLAAGSDMAKAEELHHEAHELCFIANSVNFLVDCEPVTTTGKH